MFSKLTQQFSNVGRTSWWRSSEQHVVSTLMKVDGRTRVPLCKASLQVTGLKGASLFLPRFSVDSAERKTIPLYVLSGQHTM